MGSSSIEIRREIASQRIQQGWVVELVNLRVRDGRQRCRGANKSGTDAAGTSVDVQGCEEEIEKGFEAIARLSRGRVMDGAWCGRGPQCRSHLDVLCF